MLQVGAELRINSGTCDELAAHLPAGILHWKTGHPTGGLANPPLGQLLVAAGPVWTGTADHPLRDDPRHLLPARIPSLLLGLVFVAATGCLAGRVAGTTAGFAAAFAAALCPDIVAHSGLATLDLPVAAFTALASWLAWRALVDGSRRAWFGFAIAIAAAAMIKATALHSFVALVAGAFGLPARPPSRVRRAAALGALGFAAIAVSTWLLYGPGPARFGLPEPLVQGLADKLGQGEHGHFSYLLGERSRAGFAHYFLVALAVKIPLALQILGALGAIALLRRRGARETQAFAAFVLLPALWLLVAMSFFHRVHIGVRHVLPAYPALLALAGVGWAWLFGAGRAARALAVALAAWAGVSAARIAPDDLAYFHELAGGPARGDEFLIDSNLDWGQAEGRYRAWAAGRDVVLNPATPATGLVAANVNALHGILAPDDLRLRWLRRLTPVQSFGHAIRVFDVDEDALRRAAENDPVAALDYAWWLVGVGRAEEAESPLARAEASGLSTDPRHGPELWRVVAEAALARRAWSKAAAAAGRAGDPDLAAEAEHRRRLAEGTTPSIADAARAVRALARRGHRAEASALGRAIFGVDPLVAQAGPGGMSWTEAGRLKALGAEREALEAVGHALATDPGNADALWLYGELVVRRKLGLTEYELPDVDWSALGATR